ncbi:diguanylate cyclase/phosphodiesterase, partial [mine drainage metagenome]
SSVDGQRLILEFQENEVVTNLRHAWRFSQQTRALGCRLALERFGVGLNSFQLLDHVDADFLKLDRSFVNDLARN